MKNRHILPTDKPSRLQINRHNTLFLSMEAKSYPDCTNQNIYITNDEEIKEGDFVLNISNNKIFKQDSSKPDAYTLSFWKKIILTTDQDLIKDGVQDIPDEFLEWFVKNPSYEEVQVLKYKSNNMHKMNLGYKIILPKEEPKQYPKSFKELFANTGIEPTTDEDGNINYNFKATMKEEPNQELVNQLAEQIAYKFKLPKQETTADYINRHIVEAMVEVDKQKSYSEEEVLELLLNCPGPYLTDEEIKEWFEQSKKK